MEAVGEAQADTQSEPLKTRVAIVGGGPVGVGLAIDLGQRGVETLVIEKESSLHQIPKGQNLTQRTMEHFRFWGVEQQVRNARVMPSDYPAGGINAFGNLMSDYAHPWFRRSEVSQYYFTRNERLPQYVTERVLRDRVEELESVEMILGTEATSVHQEADRVGVGTDSGMITAEYVIGCDGSHSRIRDEAGITESRIDHDRRMVLLVFRSTELHELLEARFDRASFFNVLAPDLGGYWKFLGRVDVGEGWFFHAPVPLDATHESLDYRALLSEAVGKDFEFELEYVGFWDLRIAIADTYRSGRVFIAGDSAHSHPPYGGYGINTGLEDARNLGWKLAAILDGWGGDLLVDTYNEERQPVFASTARDFIEAFIENDREFVAKYDAEVDEERFAEAWERRRRGSNLGVSVFDPHYEGSSIAYGPPDGITSAVGRHSLAVRPGHRLPPPSSDSASLFDSLGREFTLLAEDRSADMTGGFEDAASELDIPLRVVELSRSNAAAYESDLILVRPDHFVSWARGGSRHVARDVLARSVGRSS